jgi:hypothetical protein
MVVADWRSVGSRASHEEHSADASGVLARSSSDATGGSTIANTIGVGAALVLDEFALILNPADGTGRPYRHADGCG